MCRFTSPFLSFLVFVWMLDSYGWLTPRSDLLKRQWLAKGSNLKGSPWITIHIFAEEVASGDTFVFNDIGKDPKTPKTNMGLLGLPVAQNASNTFELWLWVALWHFFCSRECHFASEREGNPVTKMRWWNVSNKKNAESAIKFVRLSDTKWIVAVWYKGGVCGWKIKLGSST